MLISRKRYEEALNDAYDDGVQTGMHIGYMSAETEITNYIAAIGDMDWLLDELDQRYVQEAEEIE